MCEWLRLIQWLAILGPEQILGGKPLQQLLPG
jgi:hypothetical protein